MWRGETDIDKIHVDFSCRNLKGVEYILMKVLQVLDPELGEEEVVALQLQTEFPQAYWFTLNVTFYIMKDELFAA